MREEAGDKAVEAKYNCSADSRCTSSADGRSNSSADSRSDQPAPLSRRRAAKL